MFSQVLKNREYRSVDFSTYEPIPNDKALGKPILHHICAHDALNLTRYCIEELEFSVFV